MKERGKRRKCENEKLIFGKSSLIFKSDHNLACFNIHNSFTEISNYAVSVFYERCPLPVEREKNKTQVKAEEEEEEIKNNSVFNNSYKLVHHFEKPNGVLSRTQTRREAEKR